MIRRQKTAASRNFPLARFGRNADVRRSPRRRDRLRLSAGRERVDEGALDRAPGRGRASVAAAGGIFGRLVVGAENFDIRLQLSGHPVVLRTRRIE